MSPFIARALPLLILFGMCSFAQSDQESLWLDESHLIIPLATSVTLSFNLDSMPEDKPVLWLATRLVYPIEVRPAHRLGIEVNGTIPEVSTVYAAQPTFERPCAIGFPPRDIPKRGDEAHPQWVTRLDDNFTIGQADPTAHYRTQAPRGLEPSLALDLTGLLKKGRNEIVLTNWVVSGDILKVRGVELPESPGVPWGALHALFVKVGSIAPDEIRAFDTAHTVPFGVRTLHTFDLLSDEGFAEMEAYYTDAPNRVDDPRLKALFHFIHGWNQMMKKRPAKAAALIEKGLAFDAESEDAAEAMFVLGLALHEANRPEEAAAAWDRLLEEIPYSKYQGQVERERAIRSWGDKPAPINWPTMEASRANSPIVVDGKLDEAAWREGPAFTDFCVYRKRFERPPVRTEAMFRYDDENLYLGVVCHEPVMNETFNPNTEHDSRVWRDDCVEFFIDPGRRYVTLFEFEVGIENGYVDVVNIPGAYSTYDPEWLHVATKAADRWFVEIAIPWKELWTDAPRTGDVWLANVPRIRPNTENREGMYIVSGPSEIRFADPARQAYLVFH